MRTSVIGEDPGEKNVEGLAANFLDEAKSGDLQVQIFYLTE